MRQLELVEILHRFEVSHPVEDLVVLNPYGRAFRDRFGLPRFDPGIRIWPALRLRLPTLLTEIERKGQDSSASAEAAKDDREWREGQLNRQARGLREALASVRVPRRGLLVATRPEYHFRMGGETKDKFVSPWMDAGETVQALIFPGYGEKAWASSLKGGVGVDALELLASRAGILNWVNVEKRFGDEPCALNEDSRQLLAELANELAGESGLALSSLEETLEQFCLSMGGWLARKTVFYVELLRHWNPERVMIGCWYCPNGMALTRASHALGIPCCDLQHGIISSFHIAYAKWCRFPEGGFDSIPREFWVWDEKGAQIVDSLEAGVTRHIVSGKIWSSIDGVTPWEEDPDWKRLVDLRAKHPAAVLFTAQFLEMEGEEKPGAGWQNVPEWFFRIVDERDDLFWFFRAHPRVKNGAEKLEAYLKERLQGTNWNVRESSELPCDAVLAETQLHVTYSSSVALEADKQGISTIFLGDDIDDYFAPLLEPGSYVVAADAKTFLESADRFLESDRSGEKAESKGSLKELLRPSQAGKSREPEIVQKWRRRGVYLAERVGKGIRSRLSAHQRGYSDPAALLRMDIESAGKLGLPLKVVIGAGPDVYPGWISTTYPYFDATDAESWERAFSGQPIDALLAEHVVEHLTEEQFARVLQNAKHFLAPGGWFRVAVPDGYFPNEDYIENVRPGGSGPGCDDHKLLYTWEILSEAVEREGMTCDLLEWWSADGEFHRVDWRVEDGMVKRSADHDTRNENGTLRYTSLIADVRRA